MSSRRGVVKVSPREVIAAQVQIHLLEAECEPIPDDLRAIANAATPDDQEVLSLIAELQNKLDRWVDEADTQRTLADGLDDELNDLRQAISGTVDGLRDLLRDLELSEWRIAYDNRLSPITEAERDLRALEDRVGSLLDMFMEVCD